MLLKEVEFEARRADRIRQICSHPRRRLARLEDWLHGEIGGAGLKGQNVLESMDRIRIGSRGGERMNFPCLDTFLGTLSLEVLEDPDFLEIAEIAAELVSGQRLRLRFLTGLYTLHAKRVAEESPDPEHVVTMCGHIVRSAFSPAGLSQYFDGCATMRQRLDYALDRELGRQEVLFAGASIVDEGGTPIPIEPLLVDREHVLRVVLTRVREADWRSVPIFEYDSRLQISVRLEDRDYFSVRPSEKVIDLQHCRDVEVVTQDFIVTPRRLSAGNRVIEVGLRLAGLRQSLGRILLSCTILDPTGGFINFVDDT